MGIKLFVACSLCCLLFCSCEKDIGTIGINMLPGTDILYLKTDSLYAGSCKYLKDDSIRTSDFTLLLGSYKDPVFGGVSAEICIPLYIDNPIIDNSLYAISNPYGKQVTIDSVRLLIIRDTAASFHYGTPSTETIKLYEMLEKIDTLNYINLQFTPAEKLIGTYSLGSASTDSVYILLGNSFNQKFATFINDTGKYGQAKDPLLVNMFLYDYFKGFHIKTSQSSYIEKIDDIQLIINAIDSKGQYVTQSLFLSNFIDRQTLVYFHPLVKFGLTPTAKITDSVGKSNVSNLYLQPMMGYKANITLPNLDIWRKDSHNIVINIAKLTLPIVKDTNFPAVSVLTLNVLDKLGNLLYTFPSQEILDSNRYTFYINTFVKWFLNPKKNTLTTDNYQFELVCPNNNQYINRSVIDAKKISLHLTYTKYK